MSTLWYSATDLLPERIRQRLRSSSGARQILLNVGWLSFDKVYATALGFVVSVLVARYLGREDLGLFTYTLAFVTLFRVPANLGIEEVLVRELVRYPEQRHEILGTAFTLRLLSGTVVIAAIALVVQFARPNDPVARHLVIITSLLNIPQAATLISRWYNARLLAKYNVLAGNAALTLISVGRLAMVYYRASVVWFVWSNVALIFFQAVMLALFYIGTGESIRRWRFRWTWGRQMLLDAWPRIPDGVAGSIQGQLGAVMLGTMLGNDKLGPYAVAFRFYGLLLVVPDIFCQSLAPALTRARDSGEALFKRRLIQAYRLLYALFLLTLIPIAILGIWGIRRLYGPQFADAGRLTLYMAVPLLLIYLNQLRLWYVIIENRFQYAMYVSFIQMAVTVAANYILIRRFGAAGAIAALAVGALIVIVCDGIFRPARVNTVAILEAISFRNRAGESSA